MSQSQNLKNFSLCIGISLLLLLSFLVPSTANLWHAIDLKIFYWLNSYVAKHPAQQVFWAVTSITNIKIADIFGALFLLGFFLLYIFEVSGQERKTRVVQLLYTVLWFEIAMLLCKQLMTPFLIKQGFSRYSPTEVLPEVFRLSTVLPFLKVKDSSQFCFPADHGSIVLLWCGFLWYFGSWKRGLLAFLFSTIFLVPRLLSGAHWLSDLLVGSLAWVLVLMSIALFSPVYEWGMKAITKVVFRNRLAKDTI